MGFKKENQQKKKKKKKRKEEEEKKENLSPTRFELAFRREKQRKNTELNHASKQ